MLTDYGNQHDIAIVILGQDGKYTLISPTVSSKVWRRMDKDQMASYNSLRDDMLAGAPRPPRRRHIRSPPPPPRPPSRTRHIRSPPPPLRPLATGGMYQDQISSMMSILQAQNDVLRRLQEQQEQQALANAQITTSMSLLADSIKTRVEIQCDVDEEEEHNGYEMGKVD